ncbi:MAG: DUF547 domain-containing protein, partial [Coleofasciculaceae cyanobacterium]
TLTQWLADIKQADITALNSDQQLALWINLYNAFTVASILESYPIISIQPKILGIPNLLAFAWFFYRPTHKIGDSYYYLNQIEHRILRKKFNEPRIHFALVCASLGCPLLRNEAYDGDVRNQLEDDAMRFINNPDKVRYEASTQTLYCSKIFKWYKSDFLQVAASIPDYIGSYLKTDIVSSVAIAYLDYDWNLNQQPK